MVSPETTVRAERLRVNLFIYGVVRQPPREAFHATWPFLYLSEVDLFRETDEQDLALANTCLEAERELREREFAALERLLGLVAAGEDGLEERVCALPEWAFRPAARALYELGWLLPAAA